MKSTHLYILLILVISACKGPSAPAQKMDERDSAPATENKIMIPSSSCYVLHNGKDSVHLKVEVFPNVATGTLFYQLQEKDMNKGELDGHLLGDTLLADYTFMSEGVRSVRQVAFLIRDSIAVEGYGPMKEEHGHMIFADVKKLQFGSGVVLQKTRCNEN